MGTPHPWHGPAPPAVAPMGPATSLVAHRSGAARTDLYFDARHIFHLDTASVLLLQPGPRWGPGPLKRPGRGVARRGGGGPSDKKVGGKRYQPPVNYTRSTSISDGGRGTPRGRRHPCCLGRTRPPHRHEARNPQPFRARGPYTYLMTARLLTCQLRPTRTYYEY